MRKAYIVTYDISDTRRREVVFRILRGFGDHLQYSVFRCELSGSELVRLRGRLIDAIHAHEDQVLFADVGPATKRGRRAITAIGRRYTHPERHALIF